VKQSQRREVVAALVKAGRRDLARQFVRAISVEVGPREAHAAKVEKPVLQTVAAIHKALDGAVSAYSKHFEGDVRPGRSWQNFITTKKGGRRYASGWLADDKHKVRYYFTVILDTRGRIDDVYPEIRGLHRDDTLASAPRVARMSSAEPPIDPKIFADPKKMFGNVKYSMAEAKATRLKRTPMAHARREARAGSTDRDMFNMMKNLDLGIARLQKKKFEDRDTRLLIEQMDGLSSNLLAGMKERGW
jgi:hypothetical protein